MADYGKLIDAEMWAYIEKVDAHYPPDAVDLSIDGQRGVYTAMCQALNAGRPAGVETWDEPYGDVPCRRYEAGASDVTVVYLHGGGFVVGGLDSHDDVCAEICARTGYRVISVDYRLVPEHPYPAHFEDGLSAYEAISGRWPGPIVLAGDSAGGNIAAALAHHLRGQPNAPVGQVLIYPGLGGDPEAGSYVEHANAPHLNTKDLMFYQSVRTGGAPIPTADPRFAPLHDERFDDLPATVVITAECDPLSSDGENYRDAIRSAGGKAAWINEKGLVHAYLRARNMSSRAAASFDRIVAAIESLGKGAWPY